MKRLTDIPITNKFVDHFPGDHTLINRSRSTPGVFYSLCNPTPSPQPRLLGWSDDLAQNFQIQKPSKNTRDVDLLAGSYLAPNMKPYSACYGGHQFGRWAGQLGDGRAITLGEISPNLELSLKLNSQINSQLKSRLSTELGMQELHSSHDLYKNQSWELQLKGAGATPYSRRADGLAVLRSSVREFLMSEAFYHLNIPTTRALSLVATGREVLRDLLYDGNPRYEPGAIVARMAPSFLRFGNFEILAERGELSQLSQLVSWTIKNFFPDIDINDPRAMSSWFHQVAIRTAHLMTEWCRVGFVHGVMNTDNMSILGLTIDYGPYAMMEEYDPQFTPNTTDLPGRRYAFMRQPSVAMWNLERLGEALLTLQNQKTSGESLEFSQEIFESGLEAYETAFVTGYKKMMTAKLGLGEWVEGDEQILKSLDELLSFYGMDMTLFYVKLTELVQQNLKADTKVEDWVSALVEVSYKKKENKPLASLVSWVKNYKARLVVVNSISNMSNYNPQFIIRNYQLQEAIEEMESDPSALPTKKFEEILSALKTPYIYQSQQPYLYAMRPDWAKHKPGCSQLSCSS